MAPAIAGSARIVCVMVGLPARGKTFISQKVCRYLNWLGVPARTFNVGDYRRRNFGAVQPHSFFDALNTEAQECRDRAAMDALDDLLDWFASSSAATVAVYDATNTTSARRKDLLARCERFATETNTPVQVLFVESVCEDEHIVMENIIDVKIRSPDYAQLDPETASRDFLERIRHYQEVYETIDDPELSYIKLVNVGKRVIINQIRGYLESRMVYYLMNLHIEKRSIFFTRHGESMFNVEGKIGGDADLSPRGQRYAAALPDLIRQHYGDGELTVWTSTMRRTIQTAEQLQCTKKDFKALDELNAGLCDGMTYEEIEAAYPEDYANRDDDKFNYRYRGGESYKDIVLRLEPVIMELERQHDIVIIGHQAVLRCLYAYYLNKSPEELPYIRIPLHTLIKLTPRAYGCDEERFPASIDAVDTHRAKPNK